MSSMTNWEAIAPKGQREAIAPNAGEKAIAKLKRAVLAAQTLGELYLLIEDYSHEEFMQVYHQLTSKQQATLHAICDRETQMQLAALNAGNAFSRKVV
ncbi:MAG TPA: hypothetical protein V6C85_07880 [Allocoleopsis sp.]